MPEEVTAPDGVTYTNYLADNPEFTRKEKARLLKAAAKFGSAGIQAYEDQTNRDAGRRADMLGYAADYAEPMMAGLGEQLYDERTSGTNQARETSQQAYNQAMKEMAAATGAWFDRHQGQGALDFARLGLGKGGGRGGGGGGRGGGGGGGGGYQPQFDPESYSLEQAAQDAGLTGFKGEDPTGKEMLFGQVDFGEGASLEAGSGVGGDMGAKAAFEMVAEPIVSGQVTGDDALNLLLDAAEETGLESTEKAAWVASTANYFGLDQITAQEVLDTGIYGEGLSMNTSWLTDEGFRNQTINENQRLAARAGVEYVDNVWSGDPDGRGVANRGGGEVRKLASQSLREQDAEITRMENAAKMRNTKGAGKGDDGRNNARPERRGSNSGDKPFEWVARDAAAKAKAEAERKRAIKLAALKMSRDANQVGAFY